MKPMWGGDSVNSHFIPEFKPLQRCEVAEGLWEHFQYFYANKQTENIFLQKTYIVGKNFIFSGLQVKQWKC